MDKWVLMAECFILCRVFQWLKCFGLCEQAEEYFAEVSSFFCETVNFGTAVDSLLLEVWIENSMFQNESNKYFQARGTKFYVWRTKEIFFVLNPSVQVCFQQMILTFQAHSCTCAQFAHLLLNTFQFVEEWWNGFTRTIDLTSVPIFNCLSLVIRHAYVRWT